MPLSGDLGFHGPALFFLFAFFALTFAIRRKWNAALARKEEIMRLVVLASEESARAELDAAIDYLGSHAVVVRNQCAVCYCPTTTRCSRCKVVKYCSGKCQIMHWRQGHKEECCPPANTVQSNGLECYSDAKKEQFLAEKSGFEDTSLDLEGGFRHEPLEKIPEGWTSPKSDCSSEVFCRKDDFEVKVKPLVDPTESHPSTVSPSTSSSTSDPDARVEVSLSRVPSSITSSRAISPLSNGIDSDVNQTKTIKPSSFEPLSTFSPVDSSSNKLKPITPTQRSTNSSGSKLDSSVECTLDKPSKVAHKQVEATIGTSLSRDIDQKNTSRTDDEPLFQFSFNLSTQAVPSGTHASNNGFRSRPENEKPALFKEIATDVSTLQGPSILSSERSCSMSGERRNNDRVLKSKQQRSLSFGDSADLDQSSMVGRHSFSGVTSSVVKSVYSRPVCSSDITTSPLNGSNALMTSMRKVVQQFKTSKLAKHNNKVLFPYDSFVKLYNSEKVELRPFGLVNCGKSCYANAVLQCLTFTQPLIAYLLQGLHSKTCTKKAWCFTCEFERLILKAREQKSPLSPIGILTQINLGHGKEEDAHEFLRYAIDAMQSVCLNEADADLLRPLEEETTLIQLIFGGYLKSKIKCMRCHGKSERSERMMDLNVEIHGNIGTLEEALAQFTSTEILDGDNKYKCSRCKSYEKAKKKLTILEAPNILTIALKRFQSGNFGKLNKSVRFPEMLDLTPYMSGTSDKPPLYKLYAVVVHLDVMNAAFSGHYVSYVKNVHGKWFKIDDSMVKYAELDRVLSQGAYMLFYARSSPHAPSLIKNLMSHDSKTKRTKCADLIPPSHPERNSSKARSNYDSSPAVHRRDDYPYESSDPFSGRFYPSHRIPKVDSSSDNSSLFSCSDEGSNSTDSTRDSTSTDDISDYIFGDSGRFSHFSPYRGLDDSEATSSSPFSRPSPLSVSSGSRHYSKEVSRGKGSSPSLYSDTTNHSRKLTDKYGSSSEIDREVLGWVNPSDINSGLTMRRPRDRTQAFY